MSKKQRHVQDSLREQILTKIAATNLLSEEEHAYLAERLQRQYGLLWENRPEDVETRLRSELPVLLEVPERRILPRPGDSQPNLYDAAPNTAPNHILIEGDNLHALSTLAFTHEGKVDVIYIDPPYNTGNKDFRYNDRFVEKEDAYRHSAWLGFMHRRLTLAHRLLKDTGVIFISIDDNEQAQLKLLCDEVFGEGNFVGNVIWRCSDSSNHDAKQFSVDFNHTLVYSKQVAWEPNKIERSDDNNMHYKNPDNDPNGAWFSGNVSSPNPRPNLTFDIIAPNGNVIKPPANGWRWKKEKIGEMMERGEIIFSEDQTRIIKKTYLKNQSGIVPSNIWWDIEETGHNRNAKYELIKIFSDLKTSDIFKTPKPLKFIDKILKIASSPTSLILDFFAGSGTTLHAVMALNAADGGERQCILVTNNENKIAEEVCYERNRRVIAGYTKPNGEAVAGLSQNALRYYRTEFVGRERTSANREELTRRALDMLCIKENCYTEATPPEMKAETMRFFTDGAEGSSMLVVLPSDYMDEQFQEAVRFIASLPERAQKIKVYVFSPSDDSFTEEFEEVLDRVELCALPEAILRAYREILPDSEETDEEESDEESEEQP